MANTAATQFERIYLASGSPRRLELLGQAGVMCDPYPVDIDESVLPNEPVQEYVLRMARRKADTAWQRLTADGRADRPVLGSDTCGIFNGEILGKPRDKAHGLAMLQSLSGNTHGIYTAVAVQWQQRIKTCLCYSEVTFRELDHATIARYWETGEPLDKAGGYGIQGLGAVLVARLEGSYTGVVGLPLAETVALLEAFGVTYWHQERNT